MLILPLISIITGCAGLKEGADAENLAIDCKTNEAVALMHKMESEGGIAEITVYSSLPGILKDAGRDQEAENEAVRLAKLLGGDYTKNINDIHTDMNSEVNRLRDERQKAHGYSTCQNRK